MIHLAALATLSACTFADPGALSPFSAREKLLTAPAPYPANRVDSPHRLENGRLWHARWPVGTRTPIPEQVYDDPGAAHYGAPVSAQHEVVYVRVNHTPIAISAWDRIDEMGLKRFERARNLWLEEQGWILNVRTHVNPRYHRDPYAAKATPKPRATIRLHGDEPRFPRRMRVDAPVTKRGERIWKPDIARAAGPYRVLPADETSVANAEE